MSWHLDPEAIEIAEFTVEVCGAQPSFVEANLSYFGDTGQRYSPWAATLESVRDLSWGVYGPARVIANPRGSHVHG